MVLMERGVGGPGRRRRSFFSPGIPWGLFLFLILVIVQGALIGFWMVASNSGAADLILTNAIVRTMDPEAPLAEAVAIQDGKILAVGKNQDVGAFADSNTQILNLEGALVLPGLIDAHGHFLSLGESLMQLDLRAPGSWGEIVELVAEAVQETPPGDWIVGRGWHQDKWRAPPVPAVEGLPVHTALSAVSPQNPVMLIHVSGHGVFVNGRALELLGVSAETPDPEGGEFVRDDSGNPTGMLREAAQDLARAAVAEYRSTRSPAEVEDELRRQVALAGAEALANGITTFHDMGETFETIDFLNELAEEGSLPVRLYVHVQEPAEAMEGRLPDYRLIGVGDQYFTVRAIGEKVLDGALGVHGGWLLEPYADMPRSSGFNVTPVADILRSAELAAEFGFQMAIQGIGDRAARELLDIYEEVQAANPDKSDLRWRIEHCQVIHPEDQARFSELGVIASVRGIFATSDGPWVVSRLGEERTRERGYPYHSLFASGAVVVNGTDPPVEDIDPIQNFYRSVSRMMENGERFYPEEAMTREEALASYTTNPAYAAFEEAIKGSITPGKLADITVLSGDILTVPEEEIPDLEVLYTIIGGEVRYSKEG
jgi:predicted amidohydrolase YtcJ